MAQAVPYALMPVMSTTHHSQAQPGFPAVHCGVKLSGINLSVVSIDWKGVGGKTLRGQLSSFLNIWVDGVNPFCSFAAVSYHIKYAEPLQPPSDDQML